MTFENLCVKSFKPPKPYNISQPFPQTSWCIILEPDVLLPCHFLLLTAILSGHLFEFLLRLVYHSQWIQFGDCWAPLALSMQRNMASHNNHSV